MNDAEIHAELRAIRENLDGINNSLGALNMAKHLPGDCTLRQEVDNLKMAENKRTGAMKVIIPLVSLGSAVIVAVISRMLGG